MRYKVDNIRDNIPSDEQLLDVGKSLIKLQNILHVQISDMVLGKIFDETSLEPLSLDDQYTLARAAYEADDLMLAVDWLFKLTSNSINETDVEFSMTGALNLLSSTYFKVNAGLSL